MATHKCNIYNEAEKDYSDHEGINNNIKKKTCYIVVILMNLYVRKAKRRAPIRN